MTPTILLEPLAGPSPFGAAGAPAADGPFPLDDPDAPWSLRLTDWPAAWRGLSPSSFATPAGLPATPAGWDRSPAGSTETPDPAPALSPGSSGSWAGRLSRAALDAWADALMDSPAREAALLLRRTLAAHLAADPVMRWRVPAGERVLDLTRPRIMGVVNVTPDSFSDGGRHDDPQRAIAHGLALAAAGADILDIGGESTRPGAAPVAVDEELKRVIPVIRGLAQAGAGLLSIDTAKAGVMAAALEAGADLVNDVTALIGDPEGLPLLARAGCPVVLMHMRGSPRNMQDDPRYGDPVAEIHGHLARRIQACAAAGVDQARLILDVGIGFGKTAAHNLALLRRLRVFRGLGAPLLLGVSRKRIVGELTGEPEPARRDPGSATLAALGALNGAHILRVHDVAATRQALDIAHGWRFGP